MIRGEATLVFKDVDTGEITREFTKSNYVTEGQLNDMANPYYSSGRDPGSNGNSTSSGRGRFGRYIWLGGLDQEHDRGWDQMWLPLIRGVTEAGITNPSYLSGNVGTGGTPAIYHQYQQRFAPPASDRTFHMIGINRHSTQDNPPQYQRPVYLAAYVVLDTPCTQTTTETLDVFYRIIFDNPERDTSDFVPSANQISRIEQRHRNSGNAYFYPNTSRFYYHSRKHIPFTRNEYMNDGERGRGADSNGTTQFGGLRDFPYHESGYRTRVMRAKGELELSLGCVIGSIGHTESNQGGFNEEASLFWNPAVPEGTSPIQNIFSHSAAAAGPFYSATSIPAGTGTLAINGDNWTDPDWHKLLRIEVTGSGGVGAGTYKVMQRNITGFINNTYSESAAAVPFMNAYSNYYGILFGVGGDNAADSIWKNRAFTRQTGAQMQSYDDVSKVIGYVHYMVFKYDVLTGERTPFRWDTTPALSDAGGSMDISQVHVASNGDIWVADANNGLQRIHADESTIDLFTTAHPDLAALGSFQCFGVTETPGRIWAIMHDSLIYTDDNGASFTVYDSTTTPSFAPVTAGQEKRYWFLQGDPTHADHRLAIGWNNYWAYAGQSSSDIGSNLELRITWWDSVSGQGNTTNYFMNNGTNPNANQSYPQRRYEVCQSFRCSPNDGIWGTRRVWNTSGADNDSPGMFNYNSTSPFRTFTPGGSDTSRTIWFDWTVDSLGNDAMIANINESNQLYTILCQQDGARLATNYYDRTAQQSNDDPRGSSTAYSIYDGMKDYGYTKAYFKDSGLLLGRANSAYYAVMSVGNDWDVGDSGTFRHLVWKEYGWDGANWVEGHAGSKTMHSAEEAIIDGLTISFDDDSGNQTFVATDYYTVGVVDGILMDGGTEFDSRYNLYYKPVMFNQTDVEGGGILPATQSDALRGLNETELTAIVDNFNASYNASSNRFNRSSNVQSPWGFRMYGAMDNRAYYQCRAIEIYNGHRMVIGMASASKIGTQPAENDIDYAVRITGVSNNNHRIEILNNGTVVHTEYNPTTEGSYEGEFNRNNDDYVYYRFDRAADSTDLEIRIRNKIVWTFSGVSQPLIPTVWADSYQAYYHYWNSMTVSYTDYHIDIGDSGNLTGRFHPDYWAIDGTLVGRPSLNDIKINGTPVTSMLINDYGRTPLAAGEVELLTYQGKIRFSPDDVGKTLTIDRYNVLLHENN